MTQEVRRLDVPPKSGVFGRGRTSPVRSFGMGREDIERVQRERPELIVAGESGVMLLELRAGRAWVHYGFATIDAMRREFQQQLEGLADSLRAGEGEDGIYLRFADQPNRPYVEPLLAECLFELRHEWMEMILAELPDRVTQSDEIAPGFVLRPAAAAEYEAVAALDAAAFGGDAQRGSYVADIARRADELRVLEARETAKLAGYIALIREERRVGKINPIAVHPDFQRRGLGEGMMRWGLAWFRDAGMRRARLFVLAENAPAIALYRKMGFVPGQWGLTYRRPTDKRELAAMADRRKGTYIKFGGWR